MAEFCYKLTTLGALHKKIREPLLLAIGELPLWDSVKWVFLKETNPPQADITESSHINGFSDPNTGVVAVVVRDLEGTLSTLYHEYAHYRVHAPILKKRKLSKAERRAFDEVAEVDADTFAAEQLAAFKKKYPVMMHRGQAHSEMVLGETREGEHNASEARNHILDYVSNMPAYQISRELEAIKQLKDRVKS